jgi:hypothetical protein
MIWQLGFFWPFFDRDEKNIFLGLFWLKFNKTYFIFCDLATLFSNKFQGEMRLFEVGES